MPDCRLRSACDRAAALVSEAMTRAGAIRTWAPGEGAAAIQSDAQEIAHALANAMTILRGASMLCAVTDDSTERADRARGEPTGGE
jgi:hypothetical protein